MAAGAAQARRMLKTLGEVARVASVMVDGDEARRIITERAMKYLAAPSDPRHRFLSGDYYDVDLAAFLRMKKLLMRLECLADFKCGAKLWVKVEGLADHLTLAVQQGSAGRYYTFGQEKLRAEGELAECLGTGQVTAAPLEHPSRTVTVLAPVRDSLGDVVGLVELTAALPAPARPARG